MLNLYNTSIFYCTVSQNKNVRYNTGNPMNKNNTENTKLRWKIEAEIQVGFWASDNKFSVIFKCGVITLNLTLKFTLKFIEENDSNSPWIINWYQFLLLLYKVSLMSSILISLMKIAPSVVKFDILVGRMKIGLHVNLFLSVWSALFVCQ